MPKSIKVIVDSREQRPVPIKTGQTFQWLDLRGLKNLSVIEVERRALKSGDYAIDGYEDLALIERKASIDELRVNFMSSDKRRAHRAFERLAKSCKYPYLFLDFTLPASNRRNERLDHPWAVKDILYRSMSLYGIPVLWPHVSNTPEGRIALGDEIIRILWNHVLTKDLPVLATSANGATVNSTPTGSVTTVTT